MSTKKNVLVSPEKRALLTDFGVSRMETLSTGRTNRNGNVGGTIRWQAVEFFKIIDEGDSSQEYTLETDVWAFGMTVYVSGLPNTKWRV